MVDLYVFGTGAFGRLGLGSSADQTEPATLDSANETGTLLCLDAGLYHSAYVDSNNIVYLFGSDATGCLTDRTDFETPDEAVDNASVSTRPFRLKSLAPRIQISQIAVGGDLMGAHTLAVSISGGLYTWGLAKACGAGILGGEVITRPTLVTNFVRDDFDGSQIVTRERVAFAAAGGSCSAVITYEGTVYTFGITACGRLGYKDREKVQWFPKRVDALLGESVKSISVGGSHMMCVTARGALYTWGDNARGQLGTSDLIDRTSPERIQHPKHVAWSPVIAAGEGHSLAVDVNGRLWSWGGIGGPMLGRGPVAAYTDRERALSISFRIKNLGFDWTRPGPVASMSDHRVVKVSAGASHSVAVTIRGYVFSWGSKNQVGLASPAGFTSVPRNISLGTRDISALACGAYHTMIAGGDFCHAGFKFLVDSMRRASSLPAASHDMYIECSEGTRFLLAGSVLKKRVSSASWRSFWNPQLKPLSERPGAIGDTSPVQSLGKIAETFNYSIVEQFETEKRVSQEYDRLGSILDAWEQDSTGCLSDPLSTQPTVPKGCLFTNLDASIVSLFLVIVWTDSLPRIPLEKDSLEYERLLQSLLKLCIVAQLERPAAQIRRQLEPDSSITVPASSLMTCLDQLYRRAVAGRDVHSTVKFICGDAVYRDVLSLDQNETVLVHTFLVEGNCPNLVVPSGDLQSDLSPARRRCAWVVRAENKNRFVDCPDIPVDVMREIAYFMYFNKLDEKTYSLELEFSETELGDGFLKYSKFWALIASVATRLGCEHLAVAATDKLVARLSENNWLSLMRTTGRILRDAKQIREPVIAVGVKVLATQVLSHDLFKLPSGYIYNKEEVPVVVEQILAPTFDDIGEATAELLRDRIVDRVTQHCSVAAALKEQLEHYQGLNADPVLAAGGLSVAGTPSHWFMRYLKSLTVSLRGGPALSATARDLMGLLAVLALVATYYTSFMGLGEIRLVKYFTRSEMLSQGFVLGLNFIFLSLAVYLVYKGVLINPQKPSSS